MQKMKTVYLKDGRNKSCGIINITNINGNILEGRFAPTTYFKKYADIFRNHEHAANSQLLVEADRIEKHIDNIAFFIEAPSSSSVLKFQAMDLQIMSGEVVMKIGSRI